MSLRECEASGDRLDRDEGVNESWKGQDCTDQLRGTGKEDGRGLGKKQGPP